MITYEIKINGQAIKRIDARRLRTRNEAMDIHGYDYQVEIYDYENSAFQSFKVNHIYKDGFGKLLEIIMKVLTRKEQ